MAFWAKIKKLLHGRKPLNVHGAFRYRWVEDSFMAEKPSLNQRPLPRSREFLGQAITRKHIVALRLILAFLLMIYVGKVFYLQTVRGAEFFNTAENNRIRIQAIPAERGIIYDSVGRPLLGNSNTFSLSLFPGDIPRDPGERDRTLSAIAEASDIPKQKIVDVLDEYKRYSYEALTIKEGLDYETALKLSIASSALSGIHVETAASRSYLDVWGNTTTSTPSSLSHILGYIGKLSPQDLDEKYELGYRPTDIIGKTGIEATHEDFLRGSFGKKKVEVDASGSERLVLAVEEPSPGRHVFLSINNELQQVLEDALAASLEEVGSTKGSAIAIDPRDGTIRAMVSLPSFNNNQFIGGISAAEYQALSENPNEPLFNRAISGTYPSGSTLKPLVAAAALQERIITEHTSFLSSGGLQVSQWFFPDWKAGGHGLTAVVKALAESVNTFFFIIGGGYEDIDGMGVETTTKYLRQFGLG